MSKEIYISSTPHETRLAIVENDALTEIYYERENEYTLAGSIYNGKVTRVLPGMQSSFVDIGLERDAFLYITDFMEEAGDSADFEASADGGRAPRAEGQKSEGQRSEGGPRRDRGDRGGRDRNQNQDRGDRPAPEKRELTDAEMFSAAVGDLDASAAPQNSERQDRGDRGGRNRGGRNRRDRNGRSDQNQQSRGDQPKPAAPAPLYTEETTFTPPPTVSDAEQVGEGAPGADGSRRWRGRRGRRGGRGPGASQSVPLSQSSPLEIDSDVAEPTFEIEAAAEPVAEAPAAPAPRNDRGDRGDRGPRNERGDRNDRGNRNGRDQRPPRGFAPRNVHGSPDAEPSEPVYGREVFAEAPVEPIILPGEVLRKYVKGADEAAAAAAPVATVAPSTEFVLAAAWDGGAVLPGETLRSRTPEPQRARESRGPREPREPREQAFHQVANPVAHLVTPLAEPVEEVVLPPMDAVVVEPVEAAPVVEAAPALTAETFIEAPVEAMPEPPQEYEPSEASASYKVDPVAPREYRQPSPVLEPEPEAVVEAQVEAEEQLNPVEFAPEPVAAAEPEHFASDVTTIEATGEMFSEPVAEVAAPVTHAVAEPFDDSIVDPMPESFEEPYEAAPVQHAHAGAEAQTPWSQNPQQFEPGSGDLEEEEMEEYDEEFDLRAVSARGSQVANEDPAGVETLEGAADLGSMIRDMTIDHATGFTGFTDEDDDLEEDFLEEDQDHNLEDVDDEDSSEDEELDADEDSANYDEDLSGEDAQGTESDGLERVAAPAPSMGDSGRQEGRGRREGRNRNDRSRRSGGSDRSGSERSGSDRSGSDRSSSSSSSSSSSGSDRGRRDHRGGGRQSMQSTNLPAISELLKPGQEILCQIAKEPIAKKGARITSHIALPGRFLVFMPTVSHTGVSRKIESDSERRRLKEILLSEKGEASGGFIVRTAADGASEEELRSDLRFLLNLWTDIKARSEASKSPALIYHDLNLIERILRDQVTDNFSAIWVDTETEYERVLRFLQRFQPSLIRRVKLYTKETPLFEQFGITEEINKALRSKVWLKSGGSIVINQTEALVAIDINTGKFVGKTARLEDTIVKTNLDAIPEIVRQIRLRDLGGIIIIDFIDMDERKNRNKVMAALEEELKSDRAPSKVLQFNDFGLVAITRKRVKQSLERTLSTTCGVCAGTGMVKSPITVCNDIYVEMRKMHKHLDRGDVMLRVHPDVVKQLKMPATNWLHEMEEMCGKTILVKSDPSLHPEQFDIH
jgi:ribonuclease E